MGQSVMAPLWPRRLKQGETIAVIAPSGPVRPDYLQRGVALLEARGYRVQLGEHVLAREHYLAGSLEQRLADWHTAWADPSVAAVWCARGGYGAMHLLPQLDDQQIATRRLPLIGYSDITALQTAIAARFGLVGFSGAMAASGFGYGHPDGIDPDTESLLWPWLDPPADELPLANPGGEPLQVVRAGSAEGRLLGGCLTLVAALLGTPFAPDFSGAILVIEDTEEEPYRLDRYLTHLALAGVFEQVSAVLIGDFASCYPPASRTDGPPVEALVERCVGARRIPILSGLRYGHLRRRCTVPIGAWASVDSSGPSIRVRVGGSAPGRRE